MDLDVTVCVGLALLLILEASLYEAESFGVACLTAGCEQFVFQRLELIDQILLLLKPIAVKRGLRNLRALQDLA